MGRFGAANAFVIVLGLPAAAAAQSERADTLPAITVSVVRSDATLWTIPLAVYLVERRDVRRGRQTLGLDEALAQVPGVHAANRYNFSVDQRLSIRGFGARSAFSVRGVKVLLDGIPQTLPDGQSQLTNLDLATVSRVEVLRGAASALYGNASGGVVNILTDQPGSGWEVLAEAGALKNDRPWNKWQAGGAVRIGAGAGSLSLSRLWWAGFRQHSTAESWRLSGRLGMPIGSRLTASAQLAVGWDPRADNPGGLTSAELAANRDSASAANLAADAGKDVRQVQAGATLQAALSGGGHAQLSLFGLTRELDNPLSQAYITFDRRALGVRLSATHPVMLGDRALAVTAGLDAQWQRDDRINYGNLGGRPDPADVRLDQLERVTEAGPFVQAVVDLTAVLGVTVGARYDRVSFDVDDQLVSNGDDSGRRLMDAVSGTVGLALHPRPSLTFYSNVGTAFETPTTTELVNRPDGSGGLNPDLEPQRARSIEIGARGSIGSRGFPPDLLVPAVTWSLALFQADVRDELVSFEDTLVPGRRFFRNAGRARHRGVELGASVTVLPGMEVVGAYTWADYRYVDYKFDTHTLDGRALPGVPRHLLHLSVRAEPPRPLGIWLALDATYSAGYFVDDTLTLKNAPWSAVNLRLGWEGRLAGRPIAPFLGLNNLLDREYVGSVAVNAARGRYFEPAPRRNVFFGLRLGGNQ